MQERVFRLTPLTPVHIGTGETMGPEEYFIEDNRLVRFNWHAVLAAWPPDKRERFETLIRNAVRADQLNEVRKRLREAAGQDPRCHLYEAAVSPETARELSTADPARRRGEIHLLYRNPHSQEVIIPGSSIKGAIRTAIVNAGANAELGRLKPTIQRLLAEARKTAWMTLEERALNYPRKKTERDPLRLLRVSDGRLPGAAARVDRVVVRNREGEETTRNIQLHFERLLSRADPPNPPTATVRIALASEWTQHPKSVLGPVLNWDFLIRACNSFYYPRHRAELDTFKFLASRQWVPKLEELPAGAFLLRIGRFSHFESLSVDGLRSGWNAQRRRPIEGMGNSRSVCLLANGVPAPFGWVLLEPLQGGSP